MTTLNSLLGDVANCRLCQPYMPHQPRPVVIVDPLAKLLIIGQAPGSRVHASGVPWDDPSGERLRDWIGVGSDQFYSDPRLAIMPMGFCYPGRGKSGDLPPRKECAPQWHASLLAALPAVELVLLIGQYAQKYYLNDEFATLTERVKRQNCNQRHFSLPHPSPRNQIWLKKNPWFDREILPQLRHRVTRALD